VIARSPGKRESELEEKISASQQKSELLSIPDNIGWKIVENSRLIACPLLGTDDFVKFCSSRGYALTRDRLLGFEKLGFFSPVFRVKAPRKVGTTRHRLAACALPSPRFRVRLPLAGRPLGTGQGGGQDGGEYRANGAG
jgi:hypothetical protein